MTIDARNPRTGAIDFSFEPDTKAGIAVIAARLRGAQHEWETQGAARRADALGEWAAAIERHRGAIVAALTADTGRAAESHIELDAVLRMIDRWRALGPKLLAPQEPHQAALPFVTVAQSARAYPLAAVISPWNFPLLLSLIDAIPALMAGSAVLVKPSEITPRFVDALTTAIYDVPAVASVISFVRGAAETGEALIDAADIVCFTGSVPTGRIVAEHAAKRFIPALLELGGKDPAIVLSSANLDRATSALLWGSTSNAGQACQSIERIYVQRDIYQPFVDLLVEKARAVTLAYPETSDGQLGPIIAEQQVAVIDKHLRDAKDKGAKALTGGEIEVLGGGSYIRPTVLIDVDHSMKVMTEETFGPIMPVMPFDTIDEAIERVNDSRYGLSAAVFAATSSEALPVARRINAGAISINDAALTAFVYDGEKHSFRLSGLGGSRMGPASIRRFVRSQAHLINTGETADPWWYPPLP